MIVMNKIKVKEEIIKIEDNTERKIITLLESDTKTTYYVGKNSLLTVYQYGTNINNEVLIHLDGENAKVEFHYSTINYDNHTYKITINHNKSHTESNIYAHGLNVLNKKLVFHINGIVKKASKSCICNQENQIINLWNGESTILPNLLIDNYDVISSHSAYIGKFREEILFYLMSRGISRKKSYDLLIKSFLMESEESENKDLEPFRKQIEKI